MNARSIHNRKLNRAGLLCLSCWLLLTACGHRQDVELKFPEVLSDTGQLERAVEQYFTAAQPQEMREAVEAARQAGPDRGAYHFIAADLAYLDDRRDDRFDHLIACVRDTSSELSYVCLRYLWYIAGNFEQQRTVEALLAIVAEDHPEPETKALAAYALAAELIQRGQLDDSREYARSVGWQPSFSIIGSWESDQGKGFNNIYPPEKEIDLKGKYRGKYVDIGWRKPPVLTPLEHIDFTELLYPSSEVVGYAVTAFNATHDAEYELRLTTSDGLKVWINDGLVFSDRKIDGYGFDAVVIPISVRRGVNRILIKLAQNSDSTWKLFARLTRKGGEPIERGALKPVPADTPLASPAGDLDEPLEAEDVARKRAEQYADGSVLQAFMKTRWARFIGLESFGVTTTEEYLELAPNSFRARYALAMSLWDIQERAKANLVLTDLVERFGDEIIQLALAQSLFWRQNELERKSYELLLELTKKHPESTAAWFELADWYSQQDWDEDRCHVLEQVNQKWPDWPRAMGALADCYLTFGFDDQALELYQQILDEYPYRWGTLMTFFNYAVAGLDWERAEELLERLSEAWPDDITLLAKWAELQRRQEKYAEAEKAIERIREILPVTPWTYNQLAHIAYYQQRKDTAIAHWKEGLKRNPDDGDLEERLAYLSPVAPEPWQVDIPSEKQIAELVARRDQVKPDPAASIIQLYYGEVMRLNSDGSSVSVITSVQHSLNMEGRDAITTYRAACWGRSKVLHAYSVSSAGEPTEASSINRGTVSFKGLDVGSTVVVQTRCERSPNSMIGDYFSHGRSFQGFRQQSVEDSFILWLQPETELKEFLHGDVKKEVSQRGDLRRISWTAKNPPILKPESLMPSANDIVWRLQLSTVPDWNLFYKWEEALLIDAFRESPEIRALAEKMFAGAETKQQKLDRIHAYLLTDIRYKQQYEDPISGVKPHPSPMVVSRGYGDCKDKSVLFITLAKLAGVKAHYALIRTRNLGQIIKEIPAQQFNHAIVYVPAQDGLPTGRFYDPTSDGLDIGVLSTINPGTWALILDLEQKSHSWLEVPYQPASELYIHKDASIDVAADGSATVKIDLKTQGTIAAQLRQISRNRERLEKSLHFVANGILPGADIEPPAEIDIDDVTRPVRLEFTGKSKTFAHKRGKELSFKVPFGIQLEDYFVLDKREHPLLLGVPNKNSTKLVFKLPKRSRLKKIPSNYHLNTECLEYVRKTKKKRGGVIVEQQMTTKCERISAQQYLDYRDQIQEFRKRLEEEVVLRTR